MADETMAQGDYSREDYDRLHRAHCATAQLTEHYKTRLGRLRVALKNLVNEAMPSLTCGHRCQAEIPQSAEDAYQSALAAAETLLAEEASHD